MKNLTLIVHADSQQILADALRALDVVSGFTFTHVQGHGAPSQDDASLSAHDRVVGYIPRVRVDIVLEEDKIDIVLAVLGQSGTGIAGRGVYWVTPVERFGSL